MGAEQRSDGTWMHTIETEADIDDGLTHIEQVDPHLSPDIAAGKAPLRRQPDGVSRLLNIIVSQQLSAARADAPW